MLLRFLLVFHTSGLGGMAGMYKGLRATTLAGQTGKIRRTQVVNYIMKQGKNNLISISYTDTPVKIKKSLQKNL